MNANSHEFKCKVGSTKVCVTPLMVTVNYDNYNQMLLYNMHEGMRTTSHFCCRGVDIIHITERSVNSMVDIMLEMFVSRHLQIIFSV